MPPTVFYSTNNCSLSFTENTIVPDTLRYRKINKLTETFVLINITDSSFQFQEQ